MKKAIPLALLLLLIVVVVLTVGERSIRSGNQALVSHHPAPAMAAQGTQTPDSQGSELSAATMHDVTATQDVTALTEAKTMKPRHRGVYRPRRPAAKSSSTDWVCVPGTGVGLWPKPTG